MFLVIRKGVFTSRLLWTLDLWPLVWPCDPEEEGRCPPQATGVFARYLTRRVIRLLPKCAVAGISAAHGLRLLWFVVMATKLPPKCHRTVNSRTDPMLSNIHWHAHVTDQRFCFSFRFLKRVRMDYPSWINTKRPENLLASKREREWEDVRAAPHNQGQFSVAVRENAARAWNSQDRNLPTSLRTTRGR